MLAVIVIGYLLGSVNFSIPVGRWVKGVDIRQHGSGNAGATNSLRVLGKGPAALVLVLDLLKAMAAVGIAHLLAGGRVGPDAWAGVAAVVGHNWPIYYRFRGGKGIAATIGFALALCPVPALIAGVIAIIVIFLFRYVSLGSLILALLLPILLLVAGRPPELIWAAFALFVLAAYRHRKNIRQLLNGTERKLGAGKARGLK